MVPRFVTEAVAEEAEEEEEDVVVDSPEVSAPRTVAEEEEEDVEVDSPSLDCAAEAGTSPQHLRPAGKFSALQRALLWAALESLPAPGTLAFLIYVRAAYVCEEGAMESLSESESTCTCSACGAMNG